MAMVIFFDGQCPICRWEMNRLNAADKAGRLKFEDMHKAGFTSEYPDVSCDDLQRQIYGRLETGELVSGLDALHQAWSRAGHPWRYAPLRWPLIRCVADKIYLFVARHRFAVSRFLHLERRRSKNDAKH